MKQREDIFLLLKFFMILGVSTFTFTSEAMFMVVLEESYADGPLKKDPPLRVDDVLGEKPSAFLKIYPEKNRSHQEIVDLLSAGMPFGAKNVRNQVAKILSGFPESCKPHMGLSVLVSPLSRVEMVSPGVKDIRRVTSLYLGNCLDKDIPQCEYDIAQTGALDFNLQMFLAVLTECRDATNAAIQKGAELVQWQKENNPRRAQIRSSTPDQ